MKSVRTLSAVFICMYPGTNFLIYVNDSLLLEQPASLMFNYPTIGALLL